MLSNSSSNPEQENYESDFDIDIDTLLSDTLSQQKQAPSGRNNFEESDGSPERNRTEGAFIFGDDFFYRASSHRTKDEVEKTQQDTFAVQMPVENAANKAQRQDADSQKIKNADVPQPRETKTVPLPEEYTATQFDIPQTHSDITPEDLPMEPMEMNQENYSAKQQKKKKIRKKKSGWKKALRILTVIWVLEMLYFLGAISNIPFIEKWRTIYIQTAMETMSHRWLAEYVFPPTIVSPIRDKMDDFSNQSQANSNMSHEQLPTLPNIVPNDNPQSTDNLISSRDAFFSVFWELDSDAVDEFVKENPDVLANGWENLCINEAGLDDEGTSLYTRFGEQVLAIDVPNKILIVRVEGTGYQGVLAIAKDPRELRLSAASTIGSYGQYVGDIAEENGAILGMTGSGFLDPEGQGNGGELAGYAMCEGEEYGSHYTWGYKRIELHENNRFYITDAEAPTTEDTTDASEFSPALIVDGEIVIGPNDAWNGLNPRACLGQSVDGEILMLCIEGRSVLSGILGTSTYECANILARHKGYQAMNLDGGSSAIMWYDGEYLIRCSNGNLPGRPLPCAWLYGGYNQ